MKRLIAIVALTMMFCTGCLSGVYHFTGENEHPYNATSDCWNNCLGAWWREPKNEVENAMDAYTKLVYPFWVVDFPLEVVIDTVAFPIDGTIYLCQDKPKK
jgi:Protein of unknown function (DUF1375).